jgi:hypothetical protein
MPDSFKNNVWILTNSAFNARLTQFRKHWWEEFNLVHDEKPLGKYDPETDSNKMVAIGKPNVLVVYVDPPLRDFDKYRPVTAEQAEELSASRGKYAKWRFKLHNEDYWRDQDDPSMPNFDFYADEPRRPVKVSEVLARNERLRYEQVVRTPLHSIGNMNGEPVEFRHPGMQIGVGVARGYYSRSSRPKVVVLTSNSTVARAAEKALLETKVIVQSFDLRRVKRYGHRK